jgi:hypothetical protein
MTNLFLSCDSFATVPTRQIHAFIRANGCPELHFHQINHHLYKRFLLVSCSDVMQVARIYSACKNSGFAGADGIYHAIKVRRQDERRKLRDQEARARGEKVVALPQ